MIQRSLYTALVQGFAAIKADLTILDDLFQGIYDLTDEEMDGIRTYFTDHDVTVKHSFARHDDSFPLVSIVLADDAESNPVLNGEFPVIDDDGDVNYGSDVYGSIWTAGFQFLCYANSPDTTQYIYEIVKQIMFSQHDYLTSVGVSETAMSGADVMLDPRMSPANLFARRLMFKCLYRFSYIDKASKAGKAFRVTGAHINRNGAPGVADEGDVKDNIDLYSEE